MAFKKKRIAAWNPRRKATMSAWNHLVAYRIEVALLERFADYIEEHPKTPVVILHTPSVESPDTTEMPVFEWKRDKRYEFRHLSPRDLAKAFWVYKCCSDAGEDCSYLKFSKMYSMLARRVPHRAEVAALKKALIALDMITKIAGHSRKNGNKYTVG
jgi:hypothetical protein